VDSQCSFGLSDKKTSSLTETAVWQVWLLEGGPSADSSRLKVQLHWRLSRIDHCAGVNADSLQGRTGPHGYLALARWVGWSAGQVGCHVKRRRRQWNGAGTRSYRREGSPRINYLQVPPSS